MTDQTTNDRLNDALDFLMRSMQETKDFTMEQAPLVAKEIVAWEFWKSSLAAVACLVAAVFALLVMRRVAVMVDRHYASVAEQARERKKSDGRYSLYCDDVDARYSGEYKQLHWIGVGVAIFLCIPVVINTANAVKAAVAPRLVVLDYVKGSIK